VVQQYVNYVWKHFGCNCIVVFDGYCNGPSIKDHEHQKQAVKSCPDITVEEFKPVHHNQSVFLTNEYNKKSLIVLLTEKFADAGYVVKEALNDADTLLKQLWGQMSQVT
jgi:hypothetical protein